MKKTNNQKKHISLKIEVDIEKKRHDGTYFDEMIGLIFPYKPYPEQIKMIRQIHLALKTNSCALIESPTGTGKTLCLLIGCLSYFHMTKLPSKIYYVTRTHSQINQIVGELKKTCYKCKMTIIGSRELMCINNSLKSLKGKLLDRKCEQYCTKGMCRYQQSNINKDLPFLDLHQLKQIGSKQSFCPYYYSRQRQEQSEIVILPYNYFLNYNLLAHNSFNIKDSVIIFDQAHNVDQISQDGCSISISSDLLKKVTVSLKDYLKSFETYSEKKKSNKLVQIQKTFSFFNIVDNISKSLRQHIDNQIFASFKQFIKYLNQCSKAKENSLFPHGLTLSTLREFHDYGKEISFRMKSQNYSYGCVEEFVSNINDMVSIMTECKDDLFQVSIVCQQQTQKIMFLCLSASFIFSKIHQKKPKSIILTSGTLNPLNYWDQQIGLKFNIKHVGESFITQNHLYSQIISNYRGHQFDFSYSKRSNQNQIDKLVQFINDISQVIAHGIVIAFSSYELMQLTLETHVPQSFKKKLFWQSKSCQSQTLISTYSKQAKNNGAILFMVMRGKLAQGIDFHDELCRVMIIVGIPFPPINDPKLEAKKRFINNQPQNIITYQKWYMIQASRVVNQAIGRVIRHINDYGCVFLLDKKYQSNQIKQYLPSWFFKCIKPIFSIYSINNFIKRISTNQKYQQTVFFNPKKLLIIQDQIDIKRQIIQSQQPTMKHYANSKTSPIIQETTSTYSQTKAQFTLPSFPEKQIKKKKQLSDIVFKKYINY